MSSGGIDERIEGEKVAVSDLNGLRVPETKRGEGIERSGFDSDCDFDILVHRRFLE